MPESYRVQTTGTADDQTFTRVVEGEGSGKEVLSPTVPAAKTGTLTTRTDNDTGVITLTGGHGLSTGKVDVFWDGGSRRNMDGTVATNALTVDGGAGDNLPALSTAVTVNVQTSVPITLAGDDVVALMISNPAADGYAVFLDDLAAEIAAATLQVGLNNGYAWGLDTDPDNSADNPLAGETTSAVLLSHGATTAKTMVVAAVTDG